MTSFGYTYDNAGNRTSKTSLNPAEQYTFDAVNRLASVSAWFESNYYCQEEVGCSDPGPGFFPTESYSYDAVGNRIGSYRTKNTTFFDLDTGISSRATC